MGVLLYGGSTGAIDVDDVTLAHLKVIITMKLRRGESFTVSWLHPVEQPGARSSIWLHPSIPLRFIFDEEEPPELNTQWLDQLTTEANSTAGIRLSAEHFTRYGQVDSWAMGRENDVE